MREERVVQQELTQDWHRRLDYHDRTLKQPSHSNDEDGSQLSPRPANRSMHTSSLVTERLASTSCSNASSQPDPAALMKLATPKRPVQKDQCCIASNNLSLGSQNYDSMRFAEEYHCRRPATQASRDNKWIKENQNSLKLQAEALEPDERLESRPATSAASISDGCLCGCGGDALRCLRPNKLPSENAFGENFVDPNWPYMLELRLNAVVKRLEPSRRIWWREEFGGCAPDRRPLASEILTENGDGPWSVLRTSLPLLDDVTINENITQYQSSRKRHRSMSSPNIANRKTEGIGSLQHNCTCLLDRTSKSAPLYESSRMHEAFSDYWTHQRRRRAVFREPLVAHKAKPLKSPTHYIPDKLTPSKIPGGFKGFSPRYKANEGTPEKVKQHRQSVRRKLEAVRRLEERRKLETHLNRDVALPPKNPSTASKCNIVDEVQSNKVVDKSAAHYIPDKLLSSEIPEVPRELAPRYKKNAATPEEVKQLRQSAMRRLEALNREISRRDAALPSKTPCLASKCDVLNEVQQNKVVDHSPAQHIPDKLLPSKIPGGFGGFSPGYETDELTAEKSEKLWEASRRRREALRLRLEKYRQLETHLDRNVALSSETPCSASKCNVVDELQPSKVACKELSNKEQIPRLKQSLYRDIEAMRLRRNSRHGIALYRHDHFVLEALPSTSCGDYMEE